MPKTPRKMLLLPESTEPRTVCQNGSTDGKRLHVDHDHQTGEVRGLLCSPCNMLVVKVVEQYKERIELALIYLSRYKD